MKILNELGTFWISNFPINYNSTIVANGTSILLSDYEIEFRGILKKNHDKFYLSYNKSMENLQKHISFQNIITVFLNQNGKIKESILILGHIKPINQLGNTQVTLIAFKHSKTRHIFDISIVFNGVHFQNFDDIKFKEISLSFNNIDSFIKTDNIDSDGQEMYEGVPLLDYLNDENYDNWKRYYDTEKSSYQFYLNYHSPNFEKIELDRFKLKIAPHFQTKTQENPRKFCIIEKFKIWLEYYREEDFMEIQEDIRHFKKFFTLILGESHLTEVKGKLKNKNQSIKIYTPKILEILSNKDNKSIEPLFKFEEITNPSLLFKNWFEKYEILKPFYDLYFTPAFSKLYAETEFLLYTQTLETYYRKRGDSEYFDEDSYHNLKQCINSSMKYLYESFNGLDIPKGFKDKFESSIKFAYKKSLRTMLKELLSDLDYNKVNEILDKHSKKTERKQKIHDFVSIVVHTRNYYTHYDDEEPDVYDLIDLGKELKCIIEICFMKELGLSKDEIEQITKSNRFNLDYYFYEDYRRI